MDATINDQRLYPISNEIDELNKIFELINSKDNECVELGFGLFSESNYFNRLKDNNISFKYTCRILYDSKQYSYTLKLSEFSNNLLNFFLIHILNKKNNIANYIDPYIQAEIFIND